MCIRDRYNARLYSEPKAQSVPRKTVGSHSIYGGRGRYGIFLMGGNRRLAPIVYDRGSRGEK